MSYNVAVLGATGAVGHEMLSILSERNFPIQNIYALASKNSAGKEVSYGDEVLKVQDVENFDFEKSAKVCQIKVDHVRNLLPSAL